MSQYNTGFNHVPPVQKDIVLAYVLWFVVGTLGGHKFYLKQNGMGITYILLGLVGYVTTVFMIGYLFLILLWVLILIDLFTMPGRVKDLNTGHAF